MEDVLLSFVRVGLLVLLWAFILLALVAMGLNTRKLAGQIRSYASRSRSSRRSGTTPVARRERARMLGVVQGPLTGSHMDISQLNEVVMGRHQDCDFELGDDYASSRHARLFRRGSEWFVEDLESRNGTYVGGYRIDQPERVDVGTDIKMGGTIVRLAP